jgi:hypothetical protein
MPNELGWLGSLWRKVRGKTATPVPPVTESVALFRDFCEAPEPRTSDELHHLLDLWEFDQGTGIAIHLVRPARLRWHQELPEAEWTLVIEESQVLHPDRVDRALQAIAQLAKVKNIQL